MDSVYDHKSSESEIYPLWETSGAFLPVESGHKKPFTIIMPPPNANDPLHVGHAMFVTIEDILARYHRMRGESSLWLPGTDHAGIETQFVFEKKLAKQDKSRFDFDRETLYSMIWNYVKENSGVAVEQMKRLGASADWSRFKFTLDKDVVEFVLQTFIKLFQDNLVYRGEKLINYCTKCGTGYSELEVNHTEETTKLYFIKYGPFTLATTRPETKFADTAVAVHPKDTRYKKYIGQEIEVDGLLGKFKLRVVSDSFVDPKFGTGVVKITPLHDFDDYEVWQRHKEEMPEPKQIIGLDGKLTEVAGKYAGLKVKAARELIEKDLNEKHLLAKESEKYVHTVGTCYRCGTILEPLPLPQFFVSTKPLAATALQTLNNKETVVLGPGRIKILKHWLENIKDWNISRQIVWGIRIPVWYKVGSNPNLVVKFIHQNAVISGKIDSILNYDLNSPADSLKIVVSKDYQDDSINYLRKYSLEEIKTGLQSISAPIGAKFEVSIESPGDDYLQETDTFDTWFSSGQWPVVTLKTNRDGDFDKFYPTSVMETGYDILPIWVMRMMLLCIYLTGKTPFKTVYLHGMVRDSQGRKMSKSIGNVINPLDMVEKYGSDAVRMALVMSTTPGMDKNVGETQILGMRNFSNKIWNAARFVKDFSNDVKDDPKFNLWYYTNFPANITKLLENFKIGQAAEKVYNDFWHKFCDIEIERAKKGEVSSGQLRKALMIHLKLLHPFMPFVTEAVWQQLREGLEDGLLITSPWPVVK